MRYRLKTAGDLYEEENAKKLTEAFGFMFKMTDYGRMSKIEKEVYIEIDTMDELIKFYMEWGHIIVGVNYESGQHEITIYDYYIE